MLDDKKYRAVMQEAERLEDPEAMRALFAKALRDALEELKKSDERLKQLAGTEAERLKEYMLPTKGVPLSVIDENNSKVTEKK